MSLTYNMNKTMSQAIKTNVNSTSSLLALFYLTNPDAKELEIKEFAEKNNLNIGEVKKYLSESKQEDSIYQNMLSLKYGVKHFKTEDEELQNYINKISSGTRDISPIQMDDYIEIISESIPKKAKKPEFQIINDLKNSENSDRNGKTEKSFQNSIEENSQFLYSSIISQNPTAQSLSRIEEPKQVAGIISSIKKENKIEIRLELSIALNEITNPNCLLRFLQLNGTTHLGYWIDDYKDEIECKESVDPRVYDILSNILNFCDKLPISVHDLKISKIGKKINKLGKSISSERPIKYKCEELVVRWKKMIENLKDKKRTNDYDKRDKDFKYSNETSDDRTTPDILSPKKQNSNYQENISMLRKTQRTEIESANDKNYKKVRIQENEGVESSAGNFKTNTVNNNILAANSNIYSKNFSANSSNQINGNYNNTTNRNNPPANLLPMTMNAIGGNINFKMQNIQIKNSNNTSNVNSVTVKGILKKTDKLSKKDKKQKVRFELEERLERVKIFKLTDEVEASAVTEEEYQKIQIEILKNPNYKFLNDLRSREINMEKENLSKAREKNKITKDILYKMIPSISWTRPYELYIPSNHHNDSHNENNDNDYLGFNVRGSESEEKNIINLLCQKILSVTYFRDSEIPDCPQMGSSKLFSFTDENIPKLENAKKVYNPDKPNPNAEIFQYIDNLSESKLTPEIINTISQKIQNNHFTPEEKTKILDYLKRHLNKDSSQQPTPSQQFTAPPPFLKNFVPQMNASNTLNPINMNMNNAYNFNNAVNMPSLPIINPLNNKLNSSGGTIPVISYHEKNVIGKQYENREQKMNVNFNANKVFTKPCRNYHGPNGCIRGDNCHFIHDSAYQGREIPNFNLNNYRNYGQNSDKKYLITNVNIVNNYGNVSDEKEKDEMNGVTVMKENTVENRVNESSMVTPVVSNNGSSMMMNMNSNFINHKQYQNNFNRGNKMMMHGYQMNPQMNPQINPQMNPQINPHMNPQMNPHMNPQMNPHMNPQMNSQINNIRPQFMNNINLKNNMPGGMGNINPMHNMNNMQMKMNMNIPNINNMPNMPNMGNIPQNTSNMPSSQNNSQNLNNNSNPSTFRNMQPNLYMYMNNYGRMPFNMIPPQNQSNKNN